MLTKVIENKQVEIKPGDILQLDCGVYKTLCESMWEDAQFAYENPVFGMDSPIHVNLEISGYTFQRRGGDYYVRVRIIWPGDCEPDTYGSGWVKVNPWQCNLVN